MEILQFDVVALDEIVDGHDNLLVDHLDEELGSRITDVRRGVGGGVGEKDACGIGTGFQLHLDVGMPLFKLFDDFFDQLYLLI